MFSVYGSERSSIKARGFTLVEIIIVVVILSIAAVMVVPMISSASGLQIKSAANIIAADLEHVKSLAISRQKSYSVVFDASTNSYQVLDSDSNAVSHPTKANGLFSVSFASDSSLSNVDITSADFDSEQTVVFDYLGTPKNNSLTDLTSGQVTLESDGITMTVSVEPVTGYVTIQ
ncbi:MAG: GspH/FimT family protein [Anaerohalosphaera sp.]|nr:GspH/FimT family protein [Anaerohalosphaera sp.]